MTPVLPIVMLGVVIVMLILEAANAYMHIAEAQYREQERKQKQEAQPEPPRRAYTHFDLAATDLRRAKTAKKKPAPTA